MCSDIELNFTSLNEFLLLVAVLLKAFSRIEEISQWSCICFCPNTGVFLILNFFVLSLTPPLVWSVVDVFPMCCWIFRRQWYVVDEYPRLASDVEFWCGHFVVVWALRVSSFDLFFLKVLHPRRQWYEVAVDIHDTKTVVVEGSFIIV